MITIKLNITRKEINQVLALLGHQVIIDEDRWKDFQNLSIDTSAFNTEEEKRAMVSLGVMAYLKRNDKPSSNIDEITL